MITKALTLVSCVLLLLAAMGCTSRGYVLQLGQPPSNLQLSTTPNVNPATAASGPSQPSILPAGQWTFESTTDSTGVFYSTNGACIQSGGTWYATTSGQGSGHWYMNGKEIHLHGNYAGSLTGGGVNDSFDLTAANKKLLRGYLQEWNDSGSYNGYYRSTWTFSSATCDPPSK